MSLVINANITCKKCNNQSTTKLYASINANVNKPMKKAILDGTFFEWICPFCNKKSTLLHPLLYHDIKKKSMFYLIPNTTRRYFDDIEIEKQYKDVDNISKRAVSTIAQLQEKINILAQGLDDRIIEIAKYSLIQSLKKEYQTNNVSGYFNTMNREQNYVSFTFYMGDNAVPCNKIARTELYDKSARVLNSVYSNSMLTKGFHTVDEKWAEQTIDAYKSSK